MSISFKDRVVIVTGGSRGLGVAFARCIAAAGAKVVITSTGQSDSGEKTQALLAEEGLDVAVINPRFIKPLDEQLLEKVFAECKFVITAEEAALIGGFGSAVLELACERGWDTRNMRRVGIPDHYMDHGDREDLLADVGLSADGLAKLAKQLAEKPVSL